MTGAAGDAGKGNLIESTGVCSRSSRLAICFPEPANSLFAIRIQPKFVLEAARHKATSANRPADEKKFTLGPGVMRALALAEFT